MRYLKIIFLSLCLLGFSIAQANTDFYASTVVVEDRSTEALRQGLREALVKVLSKASGVPAEMIQQKPSLAFELQQGDKLALQFSYHSKRIATEEGSVQQLYLKASFPENKIVSLLQKGGLTFWAPERPQLAVLVLAKEDGQLDWVGEAKDNFSFITDLQSQAILHWGFAFALSQLDEAASRLWYADIPAPSEQPYLLVRVSHQAGKLTSGSASLLNTDKTYFIEAENLEEWFTQAISWAAGELSSRYSVQLLSRDSEVVLQVSGVNSYQHYLNVLATVDNLDIVQHVYVLNIDKRVLNLAVSYTTQLEQLQHSLLQDKRIQLSADNTPSAYQLNLQWLD